jgi:putative ABC transport system substrate-binding protein
VLGFGLQAGEAILRRRDFITLVGGAATWPLAARAQQPAMPVIGFLSATSSDGFADHLLAMRQGLKDTGCVEGENVAIVYRWAENQLDRLPDLAADLVCRQVAVIVTFGGRAAHFAGKAATMTIPVVFGVAEDPVKLGLVASLARPGGNLTGVNFLTLELIAKRLELLRELVPAAARVAVLVDPTNPNTEPALRDLEPAARAMGLQVKLLNASTSREIDAAFAALAGDWPDALFISGTSFFTGRRVQLALLAGRLGVPASYSEREYVEAGGLMSYGSNATDANRQVSVYVGRILKGAKPADLPVLQSSKFEFVINAQTARMLGLTIPSGVLAAADEVIE